MDRSTQKEFLNMRCSFQRLKDLKIFRGWLQELTYPEICVRCASDSVILPGDQFQFSVNGLERDMIFRAEFKEIVGTDWLANSSIRVVEGSTVSVVDVNEVTLCFRMKMGVGFTTPKEPARRAIEGVLGQIYYLEEWHEVRVLDASVQGLGFLSSVPLPSNEEYAICINYQLRNINLKTTVRHCRPAKGLPGMWRVGGTVGEMERLDRISWSAMIGE